MSTMELTPQQAPVTTNSGFMDFSKLEAALKCSELISTSSFCPSHFRGKPGDVICAIQYGMEVGLSPMQSLQMIAVINGKPSIYGDGLIGLCLASPDCEYINETFDESIMTATCVVKRRGRPELIRTFSQRDAQKAKLWGKAGPWETYPTRMLQMRARGFALRDCYADKLKGIITTEEARDYPPKEERPYKVVEPISKNKKLPEIEIKTEEPKCSELMAKQLRFLISHCDIKEATVSSWYKRAGINDLVGFTENQAIKLIAMIETDNVGAKQAWDDILKARESYNESLRG